jgi:hypothetical protein
MRQQGFVSHIHEEAKVARYFKDWSRQVFLGQLALFVSSFDMAPGGWLEQIKQSLRDSTFAFPLLSRAAVDRPWINFESGGAFISENVQLIPLCHRDLRIADLGAPYSHLQAYDLRDPASVQNLVDSLAQRLELDQPTVDVNAFCDHVARLDAELDSLFSTFEELCAAPQVAAVLESTEPQPIILVPDQIEVWDDLELRTRLLNDQFIEVSGYTQDAMGFNVRRIPVPENVRCLAIEIKESANSVAHNYGQFLKVTINQRPLENLVPAHTHHLDAQFTIRGDGIFAYKLPPSVRSAGEVSTLTLTFWKMELRELLVRFYLV